jgi:hypothetical protein
MSEPNPPSRNLFGLGDIFNFLRLGAFTGMFLAIPFALALGGDYVPTAIIIGVVCTLLWLIAFALVKAGSSCRPVGPVIPEIDLKRRSYAQPAAGESTATVLGRVLGGILLAAFIIGLIIFIALKIEVDSHKPATFPLYYRPVTPQFKTP